MAHSKQAISLLVLFSLAFTVKAQMSALIEHCITSPELCLVAPSGCLTDDAVNCTAAAAISSYDPMNEKYTFLVATALDNQYVALGFSTDQRMGSDVTVDCINFNGGVRGTGGINNDIPEHSLEEARDPNLSILNTGTDVESMYCGFQIQKELTVNGKNIQLVNETPYYLLLASGGVNDTGIPQHHSMKIASDEAFKFGTKPFQTHLDELVETCKNVSEACVPLPSDCLTNSTVPCQGIAHVHLDEGLYHFDVATTSENGYVALGFSKDQKMGEEAVIDCININGTVSAIASCNVGHRHAQGDEIESIAVAETGNSDNSLYCKYRINSDFTVSDYTVEMGSNTSYYLLLAVGNVNGSGIMTHHKKAVSSDKMFTFNSAASATIASATILAFIFSKFF